jgi:hypothetical protein
MSERAKETEIETCEKKFATIEQLIIATDLNESEKSLFFTSVPGRLFSFYCLNCLYTLSSSRLVQFSSSFLSRAPLKMTCETNGWQRKRKLCHPRDESKKKGNGFIGAHH